MHWQTNVGANKPQQKENSAPPLCLCELGQFFFLFVGADLCLMLHVLSFGASVTFFFLFPLCYWIFTRDVIDTCTCYGELNAGNVDQNEIAAENKSKFTMDSRRFRVENLFVIYTCSCNKARLSAYDFLFA